MPTRNLVKQTDKYFIKKRKKYCKEYGEDITLLESQSKLIEMLKEEANV